MKQHLLDNYNRSARRYYYALKELRRGQRSLEEYNTEFTKLRSRCKPLVSTFQEVDYYIAGQSPALKLALQTHGPETLQQAMEKAQQLDKIVQTTTTPGRPLTQNPDRIKCEKCGRWHHKTAPCRQEDINSWKARKPNSFTPSAPRPNNSRPARYIKLVEVDAEEEATPEQVFHTAALPAEEEDDSAPHPEGNDELYMQDFPEGSAM